MIPMTPALPLVAACRKGPLDHLLFGSRPLAGGGMSSSSSAYFCLRVLIEDFYFLFSPSTAQRMNGILRRTS